MATVKLILERSRALKDGAYSVVFQIIHRRSKKLIYTSCRIRELEFDPDKEQVIFINNDIRCRSDVDQINNKIKKQRKSINKHIQELEYRCCDYLVAEITSRYYIESDSLSLIGYFDSQIKRKEEIDKLGTVRAYGYTRSSVYKFINYRPIRISDVNLSFIGEYERFLMKNNLSANTICFHLRNFKSIYNQALLDGYPMPAKYPFTHVQTKLQKTTKRAIDKTTLIRIRELNLANTSILELSRDLFMFSFYSRGMAMVDMIYLTHGNIKNGVIVYHRQKTSQRIEVAVTKEMTEIIDRYKNEFDYIFPVIKSNDPKEKYRYYRLCLERTNRHLKRIGNILHLALPLTTYVARHSWATQAKNIGVPISIISEGLGHTSEKTTQIYLKAFDRKELDYANKQIIKL